METITVRIREDTKESLEREADEHGVSRSEHIRSLLRTRDEHIEREEFEELEEELSECESDRERLRRDLEEAREELEELQNLRVEQARMEGKIEQLQQDLEECREERSRLQEQANRAEARLELHRSEKGLIKRARERLFGG